MAKAAEVPPELELTPMRNDDFGLEAWMRPSEAPRAPLGVVVVPGNPLQQFGSSHAKSPLTAAVVKAIRDRRVPVVSFDYKGVGMSAPGGESPDPKKWKVPSPGDAQGTMWSVLQLAKEHLADKIMICGYSFGADHAKEAALWGEGEVHAYIALSMGVKVYLYMMDPREAEVTKQSVERHKELSCKVLYVCGDKDRMTPLNEVERLVKARPDGGAGAKIEKVVGAGHDFKGQEQQAAALCAAWVEELNRELLPAPEEPAVAEEAPVEEEPAQPEEPQPHEDVRITCLSPAEGSVHDSFHVSLPANATVRDLRNLLGETLPKGTQFMVFEGMGAKEAKDNEPVPAWVTIERLEIPIPLDFLLTMEQCREAQAMMKAALQKPAIQKKLDSLQAEAKGNDVKYRSTLIRFMNTEVYPDIVDHFGLPSGVPGSQMLLKAIPLKCDLAMLETWLELETLMRNKAMMKQAQGVVDAQKQAMMLGA